jgi:regulator of nucleoside diphosphate kinase
LGRDRYAQPQRGAGESAETNENKIYITDFDMKRLKGLIKFAKERWDKRVLQYLDELDQELERAEIVPPEAIPSNVITMNSTFRLCDLNSGEESLYTLVFPAKADSGKGKISILAPLGTAVLGYRAGDRVEWEVPAGVRRLRITEIVYQPEAEGDYHY